MATRFDEAEIKARVLNQLKADKAIHDGAVIASEFRVRSNRIDLAIANGHFIGIEIKTELDTLRRIEQQAATYSAYFDHLIFVVADKHLEKCIEILPKDVTLWSVTKTGKIRFRRDRKAKKRKDEEVFLELLTMEEIRRASSNKKAATRSEMIAGVAKPRTAFTDAFTKRYRDGSDALWKHAQSAKIDRDDLVKLSRFAELREKARKAELENQKQWEQWNAAADQFFKKRQTVAPKPLTLGQRIWRFFSSPH
jgi:hypothetical protein